MNHWTQLTLTRRATVAGATPFRHLSAIADLFGVPVDYFRSGAVAAAALEELDTLQATRNAQISGIMGRSHEQNLQFGLAAAVEVS